MMKAILILMVLLLAGCTEQCYTTIGTSVVCKEIDEMSDHYSLSDCTGGWLLSAKEKSDIFKVPCNEGN